jgi:8-oxo-dGTP diphosphatase
MDAPLLEVTLAILHREGQFLLQLRDDFPHIIYPGVWGFFGGHIEPDENAEVGIRRELLEEIGYVPPNLQLFGEQSDGKVRRYFYQGELGVGVSELQLNEGQDMALCSVAEIRAGAKYSHRLGEVRSLGQPHQQALLAFIEGGLLEGGLLEDGLLSVRHDNRTALTD